MKPLKIVQDHPKKDLLCVESKNETTVSQGVMYEIRFRRLALRMVGRVGVTKTSAFTSVSRSTRSNESKSVPIICNWNWFVLCFNWRQPKECTTRL
jgi:hypothetical protein